MHLTFQKLVVHATSPSGFVCRMAGRPCSPLTPCAWPSNTRVKQLQAAHTWPWDGVSPTAKQHGSRSEDSKVTPTWPVVTMTCLFRTRFNRDCTSGWSIHRTHRLPSMPYPPTIGKMDGTGNGATCLLQAATAGAPGFNWASTPYSTL